MKNSDPVVRWLLEEENPSVRYFALRNLLGRPPEDPAVLKARRRLMREGPVPKILERQKGGGFWGVKEDFYQRSKYRGTVWNLILLAELGADSSDERVRRACEFLLTNSQNRESGGFAYRSGPRGNGIFTDVIPCLTGNMVWALIRLGFAEDPRTVEGIKWIADFQRFDDGETSPPKSWPYMPWPQCWGRHSCAMGVVKALKAFSEIPAGKRSPEVRNVLSAGAEYLLRHRLYKRSHSLSEVMKPGLLRIGFPLMWNTDILEMLSVLAKLGYRDRRMHDALKVLLRKRRTDGTWNLEQNFNGRYLVSFERKGKRSKWVTLRALEVLKKFPGSELSTLSPQEN